MKPITDKQIKLLVKLTENLHDALNNGQSVTIEFNHKKRNNYKIEYGSDYIAYDRKDFIDIHEDQIYAFKTLIKKAFHKYDLTERKTGGFPDWANYNPYKCALDYESDEYKEKILEKEMQQRRISFIKPFIAKYCKEIHEEDYGLCVVPKNMGEIVRICRDGGFEYHCEDGLVDIVC